MKRLLSLFLALLFLLPSAALGEGEVTLQGNGQKYTVQIPEAFYVQRVEPASQGGGRNYTFEDPDTGARFTAYMALDSHREQDALLRRLRNKNYGGKVYENVVLGNEIFLASHGPDNNGLWLFLLMVPGGYSYRFWYETPEGQGSDDIPETALQILRSLREVTEPVERNCGRTARCGSSAFP